MRSVLRSVLALVLACVSVPADAHDGLHSPDMMARVVSAALQAHVVEVTFEITGLGGPLVLTGVSAKGALSTMTQPVYINFAEDVRVTTALTFDAPPPPHFTLVLEFGPVGEGFVEVVLGAGGAAVFE